MVGVVIVHFDAPEPTLRCLASVRADTSEQARALVVVDNGGNLEPAQLGNDVTLVSRPDNPGFGVGANLGVAALPEPPDGDSYRAYVVLNNDVELEPGFLDAAARSLEDGVGAVGGPVNDGDAAGTLWYAGGRINYLTGTVTQSHDPGDAARRREVGFIPGAAIAVNPQAWAQARGFDPSYFLYNEDLDLCLRLRRLGWRLLFEPDMACVHFLGGATGSRGRSPTYLAQLTRTRLRPFRPWIYRFYLSLLHSPYNLFRVVRLMLRHGPRCGPYVWAVVRAHLGAVAEVLHLTSPRRGG
jgi:GT2 family glycosyltransferase